MKIKVLKATAASGVHLEKGKVYDVSNFEPICFRRKSTRLTAVVGGLIMALSILFASFANELHQVVIR